MKTSRYIPPPTTGATSVLALDTRCIVHANGKSAEFNLFGALYAVIELVRARKAVLVTSADGILLLDHSGTAVRATDLSFQQAVLDFEQYLIAEQRTGHKLAFAEMDRLAAESAVAKLGGQSG